MRDHIISLCMYVMLYTMYFHYFLTLLHLERPKLFAILAFLSAIGLQRGNFADFLFASLAGR